VANFSAVLYNTTDLYWST